MNKLFFILTFLAILLIVVTFIVFFNDILIAVIAQSEKIGITELITLLKCKGNAIKEYKLVINGNNITFPLPRGAEEFNNSIYPETLNNSMQFLVCKKHWHDFEQNILPKYNFYVYDTLGARTIVKDNDNTIHINIMRHTYTSNFLRIVIDY